MQWVLSSTSVKPNGPEKAELRMRIVKTSEKDRPLRRLIVAEGIVPLMASEAKFMNAVKGARTTGGVGVNEGVPII